ncbi:hypothetical protein ACFE04_028317 [Oxalis oulophora]
MIREEEEEEEIVCLDESFFINDDYQLATFTFGSNVIQLYCLQSASTDFDLTGQVIWPGAMLLNHYLSRNADMLKGSSIIELGSGAGITGVLCSRFCRQLVLTDHNDEVLKILKKNIDLLESSENSSCCTELAAEKLEWGNSAQINHISKTYPDGFDLILGADIYILQNFYYLIQQLLHGHGKRKFILDYVSRAKVMDSLVISEAIRHGMLINEVAGTRSVIGNLEGVVYEIILK